MSREISRCACGRRKSRNLNQCTKCHEEMMAREIAKAQAIVATGRCPECGAPLVPNSSILGWYQCQNYGNINPAKTHSCGFQCFTRR